MASQTQTIRRPPIQPERVHDYLYDNHYVVSSERDHARATFKAHTGVSRVKRVPNASDMFSELRHFPRFQMKLETTDPVPKFISRQWRGYGDQAREALIRHTTFNYDPAITVPAQHFANVDVSGQQRYKFFRRPIIPFLQTVPPDVVLADSSRKPLNRFINLHPHLWKTKQDPLAAGMSAGPDGRPMQRAVTPLHRTIMTQTDYRDSEAQTDPYTPEYVVRPGSQPELLTLATLASGKGLPAGLAEVEMIERARAKRAWESTLPPLNDLSQLEKRKKMMDEMETKEWALREQEIEKLQEERLEVLKELLKKREEHHQELNTKRLDRLWAKKQEEKEARVKKIRNEHIKTIRKLTEKRRKVEGKLERRDVTHDYSSFGSQVYAPLTRVGVFFDRGSEMFNVKSKYLNSYAGLLELENSLPDFVTQPRIKAPKPKTSTKAGHTKRKYRKEHELAEVHDFIKTEKTRVEEPPKPLRFLTKIEKPVPRPPTPSVEIPSHEEEDRELAVIFLQQVIRGRAIQNMMFEGKEKRIELIRELRSTHALQSAEQGMKKQEKQATLALQRQRRLHEHKENYVDEAMSQLEGHSLGDSLDFLSKELIRLQEERRIHAFSMLAERQRRIREAEESGKRQVEERRRREQDEIFKQVVKVNQDTVDTYLEDIILASVDKTADIQAREEIQEYANKINDVAYELEDKRDDLMSEEVVAELVHMFLLPEVQKQTVREKIQRQQRKDLLAAHKEIYGKGEEIIESQPKRIVKTKPMEKVFTPTSDRARSPVQAGKPQSPKIGSPTPQSPKIGSPTPQSPKIGSPTSQSPKIGSPTSQSPKIGSPTPQSPKIGSPTPQNPKLGSPTTQSPRTQSPKIGSPAVQSPVPESPKAGSPKPSSPVESPKAPGSPVAQSPVQDARTNEID